MALHLMLNKDELAEIASRHDLEEARSNWREPTPESVLRHCKRSRSAGFSPSTIQARQVASMIGLGLTVKEISAALFIEVPILKFYYKHEIDAGAALVNAQVGHVALKMALSGDSPTMTQYWLTRRANWKETQVIEQTIDVREVGQAREKLLGTKKAIEGDYEVMPQEKVVN